MSRIDKTQPIQTLRWCEGKLEMIDQRVLPIKFQYIEYSNAAEVAEGIRSMVVRGAPAIGCAAAYGIALEAIKNQDYPHSEFSAAMKIGFSVLEKSRPTAVNLFWALKRMYSCWETCQSLPTREVANQLLREAHDIVKEDVLINKAMGAWGASLLQNGSRVLTHCNAGALATAGHGTALGIFRSAVEAGKKISVIADETRPFLQGARLTTWEMVQEKIPVTLITDSMAGHLMQQGEIDAVVVGADRVASNGDVANKIGTYMVAVLAQRHNIPFYVACPLSTIDLSLENGQEINIEERAPEEVMGFQNYRWAPAGVKVRNPAFDVTPAELVTALITEKGIIRKPYKENIAKIFLK
jgi:methylthioribose-1-phosphate isomerase